jgi:hypothetical protein
MAVDLINLDDDFVTSSTSNSAFNSSVNKMAANHPKPKTVSQDNFSGLMGLMRRPRSRMCRFRRLPRGRLHPSQTMSCFPTIDYQLVLKLYRHVFRGPRHFQW